MTHEQLLARGWNDPTTMTTDSLMFAIQQARRDADEHPIDELNAWLAWAAKELEARE